jgi:hypothetical protein
VRSGVGATQTTAITEAPCRNDILELLEKQDGNTAVKLKDIPQQVTP